jgi:metal-responsive CopG/Arc/MetJ family transcriptional regulator
MASPEMSVIAESSNELFQVDKNKITGNMVIVAPDDMIVQKKLNKIECKYKEQIVSKNQYFSKNLQMFMVFEGTIEDFQKIVVEINSIKEIKNFRYLIDY